MTTDSTPEHELSTGARPTGATDEHTAAENVREMFDAIAPTYDRANHVLTFGLDRWLWNRTARAFRKTLQRPEAVVLDLCCGTGDMTLALYQHRPKVPCEKGLVRTKVKSETNRAEKKFESDKSVVWEKAESEEKIVILSEASRSFIARGEVEGPAVASSAPAIAPILALDFSHRMLTLGAKKFAGLNILAIEADALHLPLADNSIDLVTIAYGFRNLASYEDGLAELHRVLHPGGQIGILECNRPEGLTGAAYNLYFKKILPRIGGIISGDRAAYTYLPASVERFPRPPRMLQLIQQAGFTQATWTRYTCGAAGLYCATKP